MKEAQQKISAEIQADAERVIAAAIAFNSLCKDAVDAARAAPGSVAGVAAIAVKYSVRGDSNEKTIANLIAFAGSL